jgi:hypothetical protein
MLHTSSPFERLSQTARITAASGACARTTFSSPSTKTSVARIPLNSQYRARICIVLLRTPMSHLSGSGCSVINRSTKLDFPDPGEPRTIILKIDRSVGVTAAVMSSYSQISFADRSSSETKDPLLGALIEDS